MRLSDSQFLVSASGPKGEAQKEETLRRVVLLRSGRGGPSDSDWQCKSRRWLPVKSGCRPGIVSCGSLGTSTDQHVLELFSGGLQLGSLCLLSRFDGLLSAGQGMNSVGLHGKPHVQGNGDEELRGRQLATRRCKKERSLHYLTLLALCEVIPESIDLMMVVANGKLNTKQPV